MHPYATDSDERRLVPLFIGALAIISAWFLPGVLRWLGITVPWWIDAPSVIGFYGIYYGIFDRWLWSAEWLCTIRLVKVRNLNGSWDVELTSSFDQHAERRTAQIRITQTWTTLQVRLDSGQSRSGSVIATLLTSDPTEYVLNYEFQNTPNPDATGTMHAHRGSAEIRFERPGAAVGAGEYYSGRDRANLGPIWLRRSTTTLNGTRRN
jgi:hypothetical protein